MKSIWTTICCVGLMIPASYGYAQKKSDLVNLDSLNDARVVDFERLPSGNFILALRDRTDYVDSALILKIGAVGDFIYHLWQSHQIPLPGGEWSASGYL